MFQQLLRSVQEATALRSIALAALQIMQVGAAPVQSGKRSDNRTFLTLFPVEFFSSSPSGWSRPPRPWPSSQACLTNSSAAFDMQVAIAVTLPGLAAPLSAEVLPSSSAAAEAQPHGATSPMEEATAASELQRSDSASSEVELAAPALPSMSQLLRGKLPRSAVILSKASSLAGPLQKSFVSFQAVQAVQAPAVPLAC